jgi:multimeric flavodoxin WrbA
MKISCLLGSPRKNSNSAAIAARFTETAAALGAQVETVVLNQLTYRGCQACLACKTSSEKCVLDDGLAGVLESLKNADIIVMALPVYCSDIPGQVKCFIDRTYSYMKPNYLSDSNPSRVPLGKKLVFIITQGAPVVEMFADVPERYQSFLKRSMGLGETHLIRGIGVGGGGAVGVPDQYLKKAEDLARSLVK